MTESLLRRFTLVAGQVGSILNRTDLDLMDRTQLRLSGTIKHLLADTRLDIRDWEMADSRQEMEQSSKQALLHLRQVREVMLQASETNLFSAIDIAEISAQFDLFATELRG